MVMRQMTVSEFKATCLARFEEIANGGEPIVVTKRGVPIAQVGAVEAGAARRRQLGRLAGSIRIVGDMVGGRSDATAAAATAATGATTAADMDQELIDEWTQLQA